MDTETYATEKKDTTEVLKSRVFNTTRYWKKHKHFYGKGEKNT